MSQRQESTVSGRVLVIVGVVVAVMTVVASFAWGPGLREEVRQSTQPRTLREPIASGRHDGQIWEAVGRYDGEANCIELRFRSEVLDRACDRANPLQQTPLPADGPVVAYGVAGERQPSVTVTLDDGTSLQTPTRAGDLGFPVSFWGLELPPGTTVTTTDAQP